MIFIVYKCKYIYIKNVFTKNNVSYRTIFINFFFITKIPFTQDQQLSKKKNVAENDKCQYLLIYLMRKKDNLILQAKLSSKAKKNKGAQKELLLERRGYPSFSFQINVTASF